MSAGQAAVAGPIALVLVWLAAGERYHPRHRFHVLALASPFLVFLIVRLLPWNPIYPAIVAMARALAPASHRPTSLPTKGTTS